MNYRTPLKDPAHGRAVCAELVWQYIEAIQLSGIKGNGLQVSKLGSYSPPKAIRLQENTFLFMEYDGT